MKTMKCIIKTALLSAAAIVLPISAHAQFVAGSSAPVVITADNADYQGSRTVLTGGVDVRQGDVRILADKMTFHTSGSGGLQGSNFSRIVAEGNFYYLTADQEVRGAKGIYTQTDDTIVVTGDVILKQGDGNIVTGEKLFYNLATRSARVVGSCKGRRCGSKGRVNILIKNTQNVSGGNS